MDKFLGITNNGPGIGDKVQFGGLPENYYRSTRNKMVDLDNCWVFDYNPFVVRGEVPNLGTVNLWDIKMKGGLSKDEMICKHFGIEVYTRHPRLYRYEDIYPAPQTLAIHTNGKTRGGQLSDAIIEQIMLNYNHYQIMQIGGATDRMTPFIRMTGLPMWETARIIAGSEIFIGVNSSMMNIAKCYPRVRKKVIFNEQPCWGWDGNTELSAYTPLSIKDDWIDYNWEYYNTTDRDIGISNSYLKI